MKRNVAPKCWIDGCLFDYEEDDWYRHSGRVGRVNAARVPRGTLVDLWAGLGVKSPKQHLKQHVPMTVTMYNTVACGVPEVADVRAAIEDMEQLYAECNWNGKLADAFLKSELICFRLSQGIRKADRAVIRSPVTRPGRWRVFVSRKKKSRYLSDTRVDLRISQIRFSQA